MSNVWILESDNDASEYPEFLPLDEGEYRASTIGLVYVGTDDKPYLSPDVSDIVSRFWVLAVRKLLEGIDPNIDWESCLTDNPEPPQGVELHQWYENQIGFAIDWDALIVDWGEVFSLVEETKDEVDDIC